MQKVAVITGCSSGIGFETALCFATYGYYTFATVRGLENGTELIKIARQRSLPLELIKLDVTSSTDIREAVKYITTSKDRIDVLVNNAGYGLMGAIEDISLDQVKLQFDTNLFAIMDIIHNAIPLLRNSTGAKIINISSTNGMKAYPLFCAYNSSKFALEGFTETISEELTKGSSKIYSILVEFGPAKTNFVENLRFGYKSFSPESLHYLETKKRKEDLEKKTLNGLSPRHIAEKIYSIALLDAPKLRYFIDKNGNVRCLIRQYKSINSRINL